MSTPSIQTLITQAQQVLNLKSTNEIRATLAAVLANANVGTPLNPNLTTQQLWDEFYEIVRQPSDDIMSIVVDQMMRMVFSPPAPGGAGADKQVIFNDGGVLAGDTKFLWDKNANRLDVDGPVVITGDLTVATSALKVDSTTGRFAINTATFASGAIGVIQSSATRSAGFIFNNSAGTYGGNIGLGAAGSGSGSQNVDILAVGTDLSLYSGNALQHKISNPGVFNWYDGVGGTRMTLNSVGLGVGIVPAVGDGSGIFKAAGTGVGTANTRMGIDTRETTSGNGAGIWIGAMNNENTGVIGSRTATGNIAFQTYNGGWGERMRIDYLGNVGVGVTPSAWGSSYKSVQTTLGAALAGATGNLVLAQNCYYDGTNWVNNRASTFSSKYDMNVAANGTHAWYVYNASFGTVGNTIPFTQAMTLDASGNLLVGTVTSPSGTKIGSIAKLGKVSVEGSNSITVTTAATPLARAFDTGGLFFVSGYNNVGGSRGWFLVAAGGTTPTVIASDNLTGLTVAFTSPSGVLNMNTVSGSLTVTSISLTNQGV
jgi:hypothetical protein